MRDSMQPLLLWQSCLVAAMFACYLSGRRRDLADGAKRLALSLVMLALLPERARRNRMVRLKALARESKWAAEHLTERRQRQLLPPPVFFKACHHGSLPPQQDEPAHATPHSCAAQDKMLSANLDLPPPVLPAADPAVYSESSHSLHRMQTPDPMETRPAMLDDEPGCFFSSPSQDSKPGNLGCDTPATLSRLTARASVGPKAEGKGPSSEEENPASFAGRNSPGSPESSDGTLPPCGVCKEGKSGPLLATDQHRSGVLQAASPAGSPSGSPGLSPRSEEESMSRGTPLRWRVSEKGSGGVQAGSAFQGQRRKTTQKDNAERQRRKTTQKDNSKGNAERQRRNRGRLCCLAAESHHPRWLAIQTARRCATS